MYSGSPYPSFVLKDYDWTGTRSTTSLLISCVERARARGRACLQTIAHSQLLVEMFGVILHGVDRDHQFAGDLLVAPSGDQKPQHALFLRRDRLKEQAIFICSGHSGSPCTRNGA